MIRKNPFTTFIRHTLWAMWLLLALPAWADGEKVTTSPWTVTVGGVAHVGAGPHAPYWLTANRHGLSSVAPAGTYLRASVLRSSNLSETSARGFGWECGLDLAAGTLNQSRLGLTPSRGLETGGGQVVVQQLYAAVHYGPWWLSAGSREHGSQAKNERLTSGGMTWSGNARPIPQVRFGIRDYTSMPFIRGRWLAVKGFISYGRTTDDAFQRQRITPARYALYTQGTLFHEKSFFARLGSPEAAFHVDGGIEMDCQFGGELWEHDIRLDPTAADRLLFANPHHADDFLKALLPLNGSEETTISDQNNAAGNHFGSLHLAADYRHNGWVARAYYEHYFDGRTGMTPWNATQDMQGQRHVWIAYPWFDALYGLELTLPRNPLVTTVVVEYNTTRDQCGSIHHSATSTLPATIHGFACYYYNSSYPSYQHHGLTAGSPLLYSPLYNADFTIINTDTRIRAFHIGVAGEPSSVLGYRLLATAVRSWGSYMDPLPDPQTTFSTMAEGTWTPSRFEGWTVTAALALDRSPRLGNNCGVELGVKKRF